MPIWFPVEAENGREAAKIARDIPRVKHNHIDAILDCIKTDYEGYLAQKEENKRDPYLCCKSRHQQNQIIHLIQGRIQPETNSRKADRQKYSRRKVNLFVQSKRLECAY